MTAVWNDKAQRYQGSNGKFVNPDAMPSPSAPAAPKYQPTADSADTKLLLAALEKLIKGQEKLIKGQEKTRTQNSSDLARIRLVMAWVIFVVALAYPTVAKWVQNPAGEASTLLGAPADEIYSKEIAAGVTIAGYEVSSPFGLREAPLEGASTDHKGVDLLTPEGTQLSMIGVGKGQVECLEQPEGAGTYAVITPAGIPFTFKAMHLSKCESGEFEAGQVFALTGNTGNSTGAHLHWGQFEGENAVSPGEGYVWWVIQGKPPKPYGAIAQTGLSSATDLYSRIVEQESGGDHTQINPDSGAIGLGQVMPENVPSWTQQCLGKEMTPDQFAADADAQKKTVDCKLQEYLGEAKAKGESDFDGCRSVAAAWYSGDPSLKDSDAPQDGYPSIRAYTESVCAGYGGAK
ncbi:MAG: peptidoglycan DD-metalloendopeptidase family protein [Drouetiella hepatica Uher 2000/2452]|jgi:murein DD-endopeptidase MepM/ murein hydrolase activator NlpD|uniref:Peptidoglycan DD-metalloendopeptidase family protein n=1 Tax=Drouetiella hepatica Uher 2000/2452 TaxID=904376 RepID=A0A951UQA9_9CYAN|nr:peptidoglycan DD-metalloendopeptidase family protein [Drouetiella hepatica Uher 2000/2452]